MSQKRKLLKIISQLIHANEYRCDTYRRGYNKANSTDLKIAFNKNYSSGITDISSLSAEAGKLGFKHPEAESISDTLLNVVLDLRASISGSGRSALLSACEHAEERALASYHEALKTKTLLNNTSLAEVLSRQAEEMTRALQEIKRLKGEYHSEQNAMSH